MPDEREDLGEPEMWWRGRYSTFWNKMLSEGQTDDDKSRESCPCACPCSSRKDSESRQDSIEDKIVYVMLLRACCWPRDCLFVSPPPLKYLKDLDSLVGMWNLKRKVLKWLIIGHQGNYNTAILEGPPGTGKTTAAKLIGHVFVRKLSKKYAHSTFVPMTANDLLGKYMGETPQKVQNFLTKNMGNVLFLDEASTFFTDGDLYARQALIQVMQFLGDHAQDIGIIIAGYEKEIKQHFLTADPGLPRRFPETARFTFRDYTPEELVQIFLRQASEEHDSVAEDAVGVLDNVIRTAYDNNLFLRE